jgi:hypothetical protein
MAAYSGLLSGSVGDLNIIVASDIGHFNPGAVR